VLLVI
jgi:hypothetical protein